MSFDNILNAYDQCDGTAYVSLDLLSLNGTGWSGVFAFNAYVYMTMLILTASMLICILIPGVPIQLIGCAYGCTMCTAIPILAGAIMSAVRRNSGPGDACAQNVASILNADDAAISFADNGSTLSTLFIVQFIFLCPMNCCIAFGGQVGIMLAVASSMGGHMGGDFARVQ